MSYGSFHVQYGFKNKVMVTFLAFIRFTLSDLFIFLLLIILVWVLIPLVIHMFGQTTSPGSF